MDGAQFGRLPLQSLQEQHVAGLKDADHRVLHSQCIAKIGRQSVADVRQWNECVTKTLISCRGDAVTGQRMNPPQRLLDSRLQSHS